MYICTNKPKTTVVPKNVVVSVKKLQKRGRF